MSIFLINATAARMSGSLSVLRNCIEYLEKEGVSDNEYHLFTVVDEFNTAKNVQVHKLQQQNWFSRIIWDNGGLQRWCNKNNLEPDIIISLQNTSTRYRNKNGLMIVQVVYYHQTVPLYQWNGLMEYSFKMWLYHHFYPFFVSRNNKTTHYVVQLPYIKKLFCRKFKNISPDRVMVIRPNDPYIDIDTIPKKVFEKEQVLFKFLYPATPLTYKNHAILIKALAELKQKKPDILKGIILFFTVSSLPSYLIKIIELYALESCIRFIGQVPYQELLSYYKSVDVLLFPSKLESFGLPLVEAYSFGLPIIAADLPYAREVLETYNNKYLVNPDDIQGWSDAFSNYQNYIILMNTCNDNQENSWKTFFDMAEKLMKAYKLY